MSYWGPHTAFFIKLAGSCLGLALVLTVLTGCGGSDEQETPAPTVTPIVLVMPTPKVEMQAPPLVADSGADPVGITVEDGYIADEEMVSPFDTSHPALARLDPNLLDAVQQASGDAAAEGVDLFVTSGWRSARYQQFLLDEGIALYGSEEEARKWVSTPELSTHVSGNAVDVGPMDAYIWLSERSQTYGLCQTYANEPWHYELANSDGTCPAQLEDASAVR